MNEYTEYVPYSFLLYHFVSKSIHATPIADIPSPVSSSDDLLVPAVRLPTIGRHACLVAGAHTWNDLPVDVTSALSLLTFRKRLKLHLFRLSYPGLVL